MLYATGRAVVSLRILKNPVYRNILPYRPQHAFELGFPELKQLQFQDDPCATQRAGRIDVGSRGHGTRRTAVRCRGGGSKQKRGQQQRCAVSNGHVSLSRQRGFPPR